MYSHAKARLCRTHDARPSDDSHLSNAWSDADDVLLSFSADAYSASSPIPYGLVKPEPADAFIQDQLSSFPSSSSSCSPDRTSPAIVPLRASLVCGEMRAMMGVFRLNPFLYSGSDSSAATTAPTYPEPGPLDSEPVILEWWLDGAQRDDVELEAIELKDEQDLDALLRIQDESRSLEDAQNRMEDSWNRAELPSCFHVSEEEPSQTASIDPVSQEALISSSPDPCSQEVRSCALVQECTYEHSEATLVGNDRYQLDPQLLAGQAFYGISGGDSNHPAMVLPTLGSSTISQAQGMENYGTEVSQQNTNRTHLRATGADDMALAASEKHAHAMALRQQQLEQHQNYHQIGLSESVGPSASSSPSYTHGVSASSLQLQQPAYARAAGSVSPSLTNSSLSSSPTTSFLPSPRLVTAGIKRNRDGTQRVHSYSFTSDGHYHQESRNLHPTKDRVSYTRPKTQEHTNGMAAEGLGFYPGVSSSGYPYHHHGYNCPTASASVNGSVVAAAVTAAAAAGQCNNNGNGNDVGPVRRLRPRYHHHTSSSSLTADSRDSAAGMTNVNTGNENSPYYFVPTPTEIYIASLRGENGRCRDVDANASEHQYSTVSSYYSSSSSSSPLSTTIASFNSSSDNNASFIAADVSNNDMYCTSETPSPILAALSFSSSSPCSPSPSPSCYSRPGSSSAPTTTPAAAAVYYPPLVPSHPPSLSLAAQCFVNTVIPPMEAIATTTTTATVSPQQEQEQQQRTTMAQGYAYDATAVSSSSSLAVAIAPVPTPLSSSPAQFYAQHHHHEYQHHPYQQHTTFGIGMGVGGGLEIR